jgi:N-acetylglucosaminyltransferase
MTIARGIRGISHLRRHPGEILLLPLIAITVILIALPIKLYAFVTMNKQGWLTRSEDTIGGEGQDAASLIRQNHTTASGPQLQPALNNEASHPKHAAAELNHHTGELQTEPAS